MDIVINYSDISAIVDRSLSIIGKRAVDDQGNLLVYGDNQFGQLGKGSRAQSKKPAV